MQKNKTRVAALTILLLTACAPIANYHTGGEAHCPVQQAPRGCHPFSIPEEHLLYDTKDMLCSCRDATTTGILLRKNIDSSWFGGQNGDGTSSGTLQAREDALSDWVLGYFAPQIDLSIEPNIPKTQGLLAQQTPWSIWITQNGTLTALMDDSVLAVRFRTGNIPYPPDSLFMDIH